MISFLLISLIVFSFVNETLIERELFEIVKQDATYFDPKTMRDDLEVEDSDISEDADNNDSIDKVKKIHNENTKLKKVDDLTNRNSRLEFINKEPIGKSRENNKEEIITDSVDIKGVKQ